MSPSEYARVTEQGIYGFFGDYEFLSNFTMSPVVMELAGYPSVEHAYQAAKSDNYGNRVPLMNGSIYTAAGAKKYGRKLKLRNGWEQIKYHVMLGLVFSKFHTNKELAAKLVATSGKYLEETNHWGDNVWGVDYRSDIGTNWLGQILMDVRKCLKTDVLIKTKITERPTVMNIADGTIIHQ